MATLGTFVAGQVLTAAELNAIGTWTTFTPVWTNLTVGNGTVTAAYCQINDVVLVQVDVTLGSTSSVSGLIYCYHPVGSGEESFISGLAKLIDAGTLVYSGTVRTNTAHVQVQAVQVNSTYAYYANTSATIPFTWTTSDQIQFQYWYKLV